LNIKILYNDQKILEYLIRSIIIFIIEDIRIISSMDGPIGPVGPVSSVIIYNILGEKIKYYEEQEVSASYEQLVQQHDPDFYEKIKNIVPTIPDFRPRDTIEQMKQESQNTWKLIYDELSKQIPEGDRDREIVDVVNEESTEKLLKIADNPHRIREFILTYPALSYIMMVSGPPMRQLMIASSETQWLDSVDLSDNFDDYIPFLRDRETGRKLRKRYKANIEITQQLFKENVEYGKVGWVIWMLDDERVDPVDGTNAMIRFVDGHSHTDVLKTLHADELVHPAAENNEAIRWTARNGRTNVL